MDGATTIPATYDYRLVALSVVIAVFASYAALDLAGRVKATRGHTRLAWLLGGAFAMGSGIWSMHYTGMLAYRLPITVWYHIPTVVLSLLAAVVASAIALFVVSREPMKTAHVIAGGFLMGAGITAMHYIGMAAMRLAAMHHYNRGLWLLSAVLAVVISLVGMGLISYCRDENRGWALKSVNAVIMGLAIPVMHYTGMAAVSYMPTNAVPDLSNSVDISTLANGAIVLVILVILGFSLLTSLVDRRLSERTRQLASSQQRYQLLFESTPHPSFVFDRHTLGILAVNHAAMDVYGFSLEEFLGMQITALYASQDLETLLAAGQGGSVNQTRHIRKDGSAMVVEVRLCNIAWDGRPAVLLLANDITALLEAERKYRGIFDDAIVGIFQSTPSGRFLSVNPAMARIFGYASSEDMIASITDISRQFYVDPKRGDEFMLVMDKLGSGQSFESEVFRKDGSKIWVALTARAVRHNGEVICYEGMCEDITERRLLRAQRLQAQKLESVGQLAAGIAHEINTPTQYIGDNVRFLKEAFGDLRNLLADYLRVLEAAKDHRLSDETVQQAAAAFARADTGYLMEEIPKAIDQSLEGVSRVATLVSAMKEFSHPGTKEKTPLDLNHAIESTSTVARNEWKYVADLETDFDRSLPLVSCLPGEFNQVILNLIVNAAHAIGEAAGKEPTRKGWIRVQTRNCQDWVEIRIQDTGTGIPKHVQPRIFDPFFTTKEVGKGTGQGLAIAHSVIVDKHGGSIHFETEEGKGTTFIIHIPHDGKVLPTLAQGAQA